MKLFASHDELIAVLPPYDEDYDFLAFYIVQRPQIAGTELKFGQWVRPQPLDGPARFGRLIL
jgi:hypothetical protein